MYSGFAVALLGDFTSACGGATYILEAMESLGDGRALKLDPTVTCTVPGHNGRRLVVILVGTLRSQRPAVRRGEMLASRMRVETASVETFTHSGALSISTVPRTATALIVVVDPHGPRRACIDYFRLAPHS